MYEIVIEQVNGLHLGQDIGHLPKGKHKLALDEAHAAALKKAGLKIKKLPEAK